MSQFIAEQWACAGEASLRFALAEYGMTPTDAEIQEARATAVVIALGDPDEQEADRAHD